MTKLTKELEAHMKFSKFIIYTALTEIMGHEEGLKEYNRVWRDTDNLEGVQQGAIAAAKAIKRHHENNQKIRKEYNNVH